MLVASVASSTITLPDVVSCAIDELPVDVIAPQFNGLTETVKLPVELPVAVVVPTIKLSALSSQPIKALSPVLPLSITIPQSLLLLSTPLFNSIIVSVITVFVDDIVCMLPFTVSPPFIVILPLLSISNLEVSASVPPVFNLNLSLSESSTPIENFGVLSNLNLITTSPLDLFIFRA